jgi:putative acetyltransferase
VVGGAGIAPLPGGGDGVCELRKMYLLREGRGRGWGRQLLGQCLAAARERGFRTCYLETVHRMGEAQRLYLSAGFKPLDQWATPATTPAMPGTQWNWLINRMYW